MGRLKCPDFKTHYKATVIKTVWYWHKGQWNKIENPGKKHPNMHSQMILTSVPRPFKWGQQSFQLTVLGILDNNLQKNEIRPLSTNIIYKS